MTKYTCLVIPSVTCSFSRFMTVSSYMFDKCFYLQLISSDENKCYQVIYHPSPCSSCCLFPNFFLVYLAEFHFALILGPTFTNRKVYRKFEFLLVSMVL